MTTFSEAIGCLSEADLIDANERADRLLREFLTEHEQAELREYGFLSVTGGATQRVYRVYSNGQLVSFNTEGRPIARCIWPRTLAGEILPLPDVILAFKVALEQHESELLMVMDRDGRRWP